MLVRNANSDSAFSLFFLAIQAWKTQDPDAGAGAGEAARAGEAAEGDPVRERASLYAHGHYFGHWAGEEYTVQPPVEELLSRLVGNDGSRLAAVTVAAASHELQGKQGISLAIAYCYLRQHRSSSANMQGRKTRRQSLINGLNTGHMLYCNRGSLEVLAVRQMYRSSSVASLQLRPE